MKKLSSPSSLYCGAQRSSMKKVMAVAVAFFLLWSCVAT
jgi:hypothetical protein